MKIMDWLRGGAKMKFNLAYEMNTDNSVKLADGTNHVICLRCAQEFFNDPIAIDATDPGWMTLRAREQEICGFCKDTVIEPGQSRVPFSDMAWSSFGPPIWRCWTDMDDVLKKRQDVYGIPTYVI